MDRLKSRWFSFLQREPLQHSTKMKESAHGRGIEAEWYEKRLIARTWLQGVHSVAVDSRGMPASSIFGIRWELQVFRFGILFLFPKERCHSVNTIGDVSWGSRSCYSLSLSISLYLSVPSLTRHGCYVYVLWLCEGSRLHDHFGRSKHFR